MPNTRHSLIKLASRLPRGSEERKTILAGLKMAAGPYSEWAKELRAVDTAMSRALIILEKVLAEADKENTGSAMDARSSLVSPYRGLMSASIAYRKWLKRAV